jgi:ribosomal protein S12 methylthiotransferase
VGFVSLGCAKNLVDTQVMAGALVSRGVALAPAPEQADVIVVNTCAFIRDAREESASAIRAACSRKRAGACKAVLVAGCLPQRHRDSIAERFADVDGFMGLDEVDAVVEAVNAVAGGRRYFRVSSRATRLFEPSLPGLALTGGRYAYLKVAEGCNHRCSFCAIPSIRGRRRSRATRDIVREAERLLEGGIRELDLVAQDVTSYGLDRADGADLPGLLRALGRIGGKFWIRLLYGFPGRVSDRLLAAMAEIPQVCAYLDLPIQHSHPAVLRAMGRGATVRHVHSLGPRLRAALPDVALRTTCLVGFPGETESRFRHLLDYVEATRFDNLGVFVFSPEDGTPARNLPGRPTLAVAERRRGRLLAAQRRVVTRAAAEAAGREAEVLLERQMDGGRWRARSARQAPEADGETLVSRVPRRCRAGDFVRVRLLGGFGYDTLAVHA